MQRETIFALSSGAPPAGVAVIRISGPGVRFGLETILGGVPPARQATLRTLADSNGAAIDRGLVLFFPGPASFTGEDVAELQLHGGRAVIAAALDRLAALPGFRPADAGEFTRRAFSNGKHDLTEVEGLADLIAAETEVQRRQALAVAGGGLSRLLDGWRDRLLQARAMIEAELDFSDEEDVPDAVGSAAFSGVDRIVGEMESLLATSGFAERVRDGFEVVLVGAPNVGKSSLLNALAQREAAIVTAEPGTTRDLIEVHLDIGGHPVTLIDTAGLRETANLVEQEGIARGRRRGAAADLVLLLDDGGVPKPPAPEGRDVLTVRTKLDLIGPDATGGAAPSSCVAVSAVTGAGLDVLRSEIARKLGLGLPRPSVLLTRERQRAGMAQALDALRAAMAAAVPEVAAEQLRSAAESLGRVTGRTDVEDLLGVIFSSFCIGK